MLPKSEWIIVENTHEAIIDRSTFKKAQEIQSIKTRSVNTGEMKGLFSGLIFCADCKHAMSRKYARRGRHEFQGYVCKTYKTQGKKFCESHTINNEELERAVLSSIKEEARKILTHEEIDELHKMKVLRENQHNLELQLENVNAQIEKQEKFKKKTYKSFLEEMITKQEYTEYVAENDIRIAELNKQKQVLMDKFEAQNDLDNQYDEWTEAFKNYINIEKLTRDVIMELIDKIEVNADNSINIYYKFQNPYI